MLLTHITMVALLTVTAGNSIGSPASGLRTASATAGIRTLPTPLKYFQPPRGAAPLGHVANATAPPAEAQAKAAEKGAEPKATKNVVAEEAEEPESAGPENLLQNVLARLVYPSTYWLAWETQAGDRDQNTARDPKLLGTLALTVLLLFFFAFRGTSTDDAAMMPDGKKGSDSQRAVHGHAERCERDSAALREHGALPEPRADYRLQRRSHTAPATYTAFQTVSTNDEGACAKKAGEGVDGNKRRVSHEAARLHFHSPGISPVVMVCAACTRARVRVQPV